MRYEIGEYGLSREKDVCWASPTSPIHYLWYVEGSVEGDFNTYEEGVERIKEKMRSDKETLDIVHEYDDRIIVEEV